MSEQPPPEEEPFDWRQASGSPALHQMKRERAARPPLDQTGQAIVQFVFVVLVMTELFMIGFLVTNGVPLPSVIPVFSRLVVLGGLLWCVWQGMLWARAILVVLLLVGAVIVFLPIIRHEYPLLVVIGGIYLIAAFCLTCLPPVNRFFAHKRW
jgi:hypothetical protein